jgi:EAL domain-containing protein (putative c-di-GMP-specific phosphodiesterase class I)
VRKEFELQYQPSTNLVSGLWPHLWRRSADPLAVSKLGLLLSDRIISFAEGTGMIIPIGQWVLRAACEQMRPSRTERVERSQLTANLSAHQLRQADLIQQVTATLNETGVQVGTLELEIPESMTMQNPDKTKMGLRRPVLPPPYIEARCSAPSPSAKGLSRI